MTIWCTFHITINKIFIFIFMCWRYVLSKKEKMSCIKSEKYLSFNWTTFVFKCVRGIKCNCLVETDCEKTRQTTRCLWLLCSLMDLVDFGEICVVSVLMKIYWKMCFFSVDNDYEYVMRILKMWKSLS